jgi:pimeloyl-ACP methyl ester carboxylesterase
VKILKKILLLIGLFAASLPVIGLIYQSIATRLDAAKYPPPGKRVDVGGYQLHLYEMGADRPEGPTVVLEAALASSCLEWCKVQPEVAQFARVVSYDRSGLGWSDTGPKPRISAMMVEELHTLLTNANVPGPYILVAHSYGGLNVRLFADTYPREVAGMVLVDTSHEDQNSVPAIIKEVREAKRSSAVNAAKAPFGLNRLKINASPPPLPDMPYPAAIIPQLQAFWKQTRISLIAYLEIKNFEQSAAQVRASRHSYGTLPLIVLTRKIKTEFPSPDEQQLQEAWQVCQRDLATLSSNSAHIIAETSSHSIQLAQPELVISAIKTVVQVAREQPQYQEKGS